MDANTKLRFLFFTQFRIPSQGMVWLTSDASLLIYPKLANPSWTHPEGYFCDLSKSHQVGNHD